MLTVKAHALGGDSVEDTAVSMAALARRIDAWVEVEFNGVTLLMSPNGLPSALVTSFNAMLASGKPIKIASGG